ncbi:hypothetical protein FM106_18625 [Brachybacterium faecium]|nr:hypothetical protein FM106_18625 [Brachybacterium faecium]
MFKRGDKLIAILTGEFDVPDNIRELEIIEIGQYYYDVKFADGIIMSAVNRYHIEIGYKKKD